MVELIGAGLAVGLAAIGAGIGQGKYHQKIYWSIFSETSV